MANIITGMTDIFSAVFDWISTALLSLVDVFYVAETGFTFLGVLALVALGISVFFLIIGVIQNFLHLRG